ncbi:Integral membrane protein SED5 [Malassezia cuniculi]|uniref:Integral membrane protein SED5 n=1 Tax=Malassezia cuniculi TaxID=948313 RepID=A0AAF0EUH2_9BASI|nr:Integral membrane protein SED5 [Malassezia cuniculi]
MANVAAPYATTVKDRTSEFHSLLARHSAAQPAVQPKARPQATEFNARAQAIAKDLTSITAKLSRLSQLARRKSLFDDRPVEISELTYIIKHDIASLNRQLAELSLHSQGGGARKNGAGEHRGNVVTMLQSNLANATTSFQEILEVRTQNMKASRDRSEQFLHGPTPGSLERRSASPLYNLARSAGPSRAPTPASVLHNRSAVAGVKADEEMGTGPTSSDGFLALDMMSGAMQQQQQLITEEEQQSSYMQQRSMAIESIESTISELGQIFGQLAHMVSQQGETVQRIDDDVVQVVDNVEGAQRELLKYYTSISNNRWLMLKIFGVLIVFFLLFILIS